MYPSIPAPPPLHFSICLKCPTSPVAPLTRCGRSARARRRCRRPGPRPCSTPSGPAPTAPQSPPPGPPATHPHATPSRPAANMAPPEPRSEAQCWQPKLPTAHICIHTLLTRLFQSLAPIPIRGARQVLEAVQAFEAMQALVVVPKLYECSDWENGSPGGTPPVAGG